MGKPVQFEAGKKETKEQQGMFMRPIDSKVTGPPNRDHWKADSESTTCNQKDCSVFFNLFDRKHHCRRCGDIFCAKHCSNYLRLDQDAQFHPQGVLSRGCDECVEELQNRNTNNNSSRSSSSDSPKKTNNRSDSRSGIMTPQPQAMEGVLELGRDDVVQPDKRESMNIQGKNVPAENLFNPVASSVPADWHWSTF
ncbi:FYVE-domain-containing protein [Backusella circina FSU 941]|nr:FYVE-domain-containing protein [Backusella circina FSU 941]